MEGEASDIDGAGCPLLSPLDSELESPAVAAHRLRQRTGRAQLAGLRLGSARASRAGDGASPSRTSATFFRTAEMFELFFGLSACPLTACLPLLITQGMLFLNYELFFEKSLIRKPGTQEALGEPELAFQANPAHSAQSNSAWASTVFTASASKSGG
jgi:hypothetical protein